MADLTTETVARTVRRWTAHALLLGRHRRTVIVGGYHWRYCSHRSHRIGLPCWRWFIHDGYCTRHNDSCWGECRKGLPE